MGGEYGGEDGGGGGVGGEGGDDGGITGEGDVGGDVGGDGGGGCGEGGKGGEGGDCGGEGGEGSGGSSGGEGAEGGGSIGGGGASGGGGLAGGASVSETARNTGSHCGGQAAAWTAGRAFELRRPRACGRTTSKPHSTIASAGQPRISQYSLVSQVVLELIDSARRSASVSVLATLGEKIAQTQAALRIIGRIGLSIGLCAELRGPTDPSRDRGTDTKAWNGFSTVALPTPVATGGITRELLLRFHVTRLLLG